jgi:pimeloyl-ACP methyl ester carboxylesterase
MLNKSVTFVVISFLAVALIFGTSNVFAGLASAQNTTSMQPTGIKDMATNATNIVLVHGAWSDGSAWSKVIPILQNAWHKVIAVQLPLSSLADDVATTKRAIDHIGGPVILVGHSYGGFVITNAAYNNHKVVGLVYIAAFAPAQGQSLLNFVNPGKLPKGFLIPDSGGFFYVNPLLFPQSLAQDVDPTQAKIMASTQKPTSQSILPEKSGPPAWKQLPTWYQVSENDRIIPPAVEHMFAKQMNATTISIPSSHMSLVSHPDEIAQLILNATKGIRK